MATWGLSPFAHIQPRWPNEPATTTVPALR